MKNKTIKTILDRSVLPFVSRPGRYLGNEINTIHKPLEAVRLRFAIAFPEVYEIAMSSQAIGILYHLLNRMDEVWAERVFAPWHDMDELLRRHEIPLHSLESFTPLSEFDVIGFTLQYELTYTNILTMLDLARIPLWSKDRAEGDPLILAGGPCSCNPEPVADFIDAFYIGDAEQGIEEVCRTIIQAKQEGCSRKEKLLRLSRLRGVYVPSLYEAAYDEAGEFSGLQTRIDDVPPVIKTQILPELRNEYYPEKPLVPLIEVAHNRLAVEVMRGCTEGCRFCNAGMIYRPTRERSDGEIVDYTLKAMANTGYEELSFLSLSISDYSALNELMRKERIALEGKQVNISFPSMRLDSFSEEIAEFARNVRKSGFTFAPEAGSDRLRRVINKNISDEDLLKAVTIALENGWKLLKFYFMIGLPTETMEDVSAIADLIEKVVEISRPYGRVGFNVSVSPHSPKSHTPFQWERQDTKEEFLQKIGLLKKRLYRFRQVKFSWRDPEISEVECILGRGDRRLNRVIFNAWQNGARFDGWDESFKYEIWRKAFTVNNLQMDFYTREIPSELPLPWEHIDKGVTRHFLERERKNAYEEVTIIDCKDGTCFGCGIQRKNGFREFAECYTNLDLHQINDGKGQSKTPEKSRDVPNTEVRKESIKKKVFRLRFSKEGYARYLGHLDVMRAFDRACRQAGVPVLYSEGYNPRPKMSFGQPLALGYSSEAEFADFEIDSRYKGHLMADLNPRLPEGLQVREVRELIQKNDSLSSSISGAEYEIALHGRQLDQQDVENYLNRDEILVERRVKGRQKQINIRPFIESMQRTNGSLRIRTRYRDGRTGRIDEILESMLGGPRETWQSLPVHRRSQLIRKNGKLISPLETD